MFWLEIALMVMLGLALWAWLTWIALGWFERYAFGPPEREPVTTEIPVSGMRCGACEQRISAGLVRLDGVHGVEADHRAALVLVRFDAKRLDERTLRRRISTYGFRPL